MIESLSLSDSWKFFVAFRMNKSPHISGGEALRFSLSRRRVWDSGHGGRRSRSPGSMHASDGAPRGGDGPAVVAGPGRSAHFLRL